MLHIGKIIAQNINHLKQNLSVSNIKVKMSELKQAIEKNKLCENYLTSFRNEVPIQLIR